MSNENQTAIERGLAAGIEAVSTMALLQGTGQVLPDETVKWAATLLKGGRAPRAEITAAGATAAQAASGEGGPREPYTVITAINPESELGCYGVMRSASYERWLSGGAETEIKHAYGLLYGKSDLVDTFETWQAAADHVHECGGTIGNVIPCTAR